MCTDPNNWGQEVWSCHQMNCKSLQVLDLRDGQTGTSLEVQWLRLCASYAGSTGLIPGCGTKIPHTTWRSQKIKLRKKNTQKTHSLHKKHSDARCRRDTLNKFSPLFLTLTRCHWEWVSICIEEESEAQRGQATSPRVHSHEATDQGAGASSVDSRMQGPAYDTSLPLSPHLCPPLSPWPQPWFRPCHPPRPPGNYSSFLSGPYPSHPTGVFPPTRQPSTAPQHLSVVSQALHCQHNASGPALCS